MLQALLYDHLRRRLFTSTLFEVMYPHERPSSLFNSNPLFSTLILLHFAPCARAKASNHVGVHVPGTLYMNMYMCHNRGRVLSSAPQGMGCCLCHADTGGSNGSRVARTQRSTGE